MTKRAAFNTGQDHQAVVATWARKRLVDRGGATFDDETGHRARPRQVGCLFADGVGLGKTWEALATIALVLDKRDWNRRRRARRGRGRRRARLRQRRAHVLILVPPGLVAKWSTELRNPDGFQQRLERWSHARSREFVARTLAPDHCFEIRRRGDLHDLPSGRFRHGRYVLPAGTYTCNLNVFLARGGRGLDRVTALKNQRWDVVVVDEAHHGQARKALGRLRRASSVVLLTATPFQLDMTELHGLTKHLLERNAPAHKVLKRGHVRGYAKAADRAFDGGCGPTTQERRGAERVLGQLIACSRVGKQKRLYFAIDGNGAANRVGPPTDLDQETGLREVFKRSIEAPMAFKEWYVRRRLEFAGAEASDRPKYVAVELRKLLSVRQPPPAAPKLEALRAWARREFVKDLQASLNDGWPRKLLLFTHLKTGVVARIREVLEADFRAAHQGLAKTKPWQEARARAPDGFAKVKSALQDHVASNKRWSAKLAGTLAKVERRIHDSVFWDLFGVPAYARRVQRELLRVIGRGHHSAGVIGGQGQEAVAAAWYRHQAGTKRNAAFAVFDAVAKAQLAATFTGDDTRRERDAVAEAFKMATAPWILIATNVGSEGIDLHAYSRHLVHFDLEWNPARMEQREGRIDRLGRVLKERVRIYYLLVKDTYDERMFHQLVARQRWHAVLLGRTALQLTREEGAEARWISVRQAENMSLNLDPRRGGRR